MFPLKLDFLPIEGDDLIEVYRLPVGKGTDRGGVAKYAGGQQHHAAELGVVGMAVLRTVDGMPPAQPGVVEHRIPGQGFQDAHRPEPMLVLPGVLIQVPVWGQIDQQLRPGLVLLRRVHGVSAHSHRNKGVVVVIFSGRNDANIQMDIFSRNRFVHDPVKLAEMGFDMGLNGIHIRLVV